MDNKNKETEKRLKKEYASIMHIGEHKRDASDKISGFLYQDILSIDILLGSKKEDKMYIEFCEDIFVENEKDISIYQVKYCPGNNVGSKKEIGENLFYQYLKYKLHEKEGDEKEVNTYLLYYRENGELNNNVDLKSCVIKENDFKKIDKEEIKEKLYEIGEKATKDETKEEIDDKTKEKTKKGPLVKRRDLLFKEVASDTLLSSFKYKFVLKKHIDEEKKKVKEELYKEFVKNEKEEKEKFPLYEKDQIEDILFAVAIEYIQSSYYKKEKDDYKKRAIQREGFLHYVERVVGPDKEKQKMQIIYALLGFIDEAYSEWVEHIDDEKKEAIEYYEEIYFSTRKFIKEKMKKAEHRHRLYNTLGDKRDLYGKELDLTEEQSLVYTFKDRIGTVLNIIWKVMFDINEKDFSNLIKNEKEYFALIFSEEKNKKVVIIPDGGSERTQANNNFKKYFKVVNKPDKWYFKNCLYRGFHKYSQEVNDIKEAVISGHPDPYMVNDIRKNDYFYIECLDCVDIEYGRCAKDNMDYMFGPDCIKEVR